MNPVPFSAEAPGLAWSVAKAFMALGFLCLMAYVVFRYVAPIMNYRKGKGSSSLKIEERFPLEPRRSLYIVKAGKRRMLLGSSEGGVGLIADITNDEKNPSD